MAKAKTEPIENEFEDACEKYFNALSDGENKATLKKLFDDMILCFEEDGGWLQLFPSDIYINNDIVDFAEAKKYLSHLYWE